MWIDGFLVSKETVALRRWESETKIWFYRLNECQSIHVEYNLSRAPSWTHWLMLLKTPNLKFQNDSYHLQYLKMKSG